MSDRIPLLCIIALGKPFQIILYLCVEVEVMTLQHYSDVPLSLRLQSRSSV